MTNIDVFRMETGSENTFQGFYGIEGNVKAEYVTNEKITALRMEVMCSKLEVLSEKVSSLERENKSLWNIVGESEKEKIRIDKLEKRVRALEDENRMLGKVIEEGLKELDGLKRALTLTPRDVCIASPTRGLRQDFFMIFNASYL